MILAELHLHNYKQYAGEHRVDFPPQGIVAVIGANGVGKTTLFEAIEWCLYNPREIANDEVPPRGGVGQTEVRVVLEDPRDGCRYVVVRTLKRGVTNAEVYREDRPESPLVQGTRQVSDYVSRRLIGLGHRAFVSTFFTRQKELSFFGNLKETDRRREVARLLGFDTIREAQRLIGEERSRARAEAASLQLQYDEQATGRDFPGEIAAAEDAIAASGESAANAQARHAAAAELLAQAQRDVEGWRERERADGALREELTRVRGEERTEEARREGAARAIAELEQAAAQRAALAPAAVAEPERAAALAALDADQARFQQQERFRGELKRAEQAGHEAAEGLAREVGGTGAADAGVAGWGWTVADRSDPIAGAERLLGVLLRLDVEGAQARTAALAECRQLADARDQILGKAGRYRERFAQVEGELAALLAAGDPGDEIAAARQARERALREAADALARAEQAAATRARYDPLVAALREQRFGERCPTCARPFSRDEAELTVAALEDQQDRLRAEERTERERQAAARRLAQAADEDEERASGRLKQVGEATARRDAALPQVREIEEEGAAAEAACTAALTDHGLREAPAAEAVKAAQRQVDLLCHIAGLDRVLIARRDALRRAAAEAAAARQELAALGPVDFDPAAHEAAREALRAAQAAAARIAQIDQQLTRLPEHQATRAAAEGALARLTAERTESEGRRASLGFDPGALAAARTAETEAAAAERGEREALIEAEQVRRDTERARDLLAAEQTRLALLAERAVTRGREGDELDRMYREFSRFDQYVAAHVTPRLAEHAGELLGAVTDGKYDRVEFDDNYGLKIFDGDERFPVEEFSGGERDIAALCARLALSRLIGAQAAHPPRFLVLDEVFGSLDQERRAQVLDTLGTLTANSEAFRQLFIISHVEDVRFSGIVDEVWRIGEEDGVSRFENVTRAGGLEES